MGGTELLFQKTKEGIASDAVSIVVPDATVYLPLDELVDFEQERDQTGKRKDQTGKRDCPCERNAWQ